MTVKTFLEIEQMEGHHYDKENADFSSLTAWYDRAREKQFSEFSVEDWCKCVRQELYLKYLIEWPIAELRKDPLAGEMYDGELANAFTSVSHEFWMCREQAKEEVKAIFRSAYDQYPDNVQRNIDDVLRRWNGNP